MAELSRLSSSSARCPASSTSVNDLADRAGDQRHPLKRLRPIASGRLPASTAFVAAPILGIAAARRGRAAFADVRAVLPAPTSRSWSLYSIVLKHLVIIDVLTIAAGFVLRAAAGAVAVVRANQPLAARLHDAARTLSRAEQAPARADAPRRRRHDAPADSRGIQPVSARPDDCCRHRVHPGGVQRLCDEPGNSRALNTTRLGLTIPFVLYGIFRYLYLVHQKRAGGSPADLLLTDRPLLACVGTVGPQRGTDPLFPVGTLNAGHYRITDTRRTASSPRHRARGRRQDPSGDGDRGLRPGDGARRLSAHARRATPTRCSN